MSDIIEPEEKSFRLLQLYSRFQEGKIIKKVDVAREFGVAKRSIQRDIEYLRYYFEKQTPSSKLLYSPKRKGYFLKIDDENILSNSEMLAVCKILLASRSLIEIEMFPSFKETIILE